MNGKSHDNQCCPPSRAYYPCRASRPAIAAQAPAGPALPRAHVQARHVPITQFGIQHMIIGLAYPPRVTAVQMWPDPYPSVTFGGMLANQAAG
jgi:hypothetical protein